MGEESAETKTSEQVEREEREVKEEMKRIEEDPPKNLEDWPTGRAKYQTFGGPEGEHSYDEGPEAKLGPSGLKRHDDGSVTVDGEPVDDPEQHKGDPIPGGPTDPDASSLAGEK